MSDWLLGIALGVRLGLHTWFVVGRIKKHLLLQGLTATVVALRCLNIWGTMSMLLAHLAVCVALFDCVFLLANWLRPRWRQHISQIQKSHLLPIILFLLTLDHQPLETAENAAAGVDLMLSGHTHAGQLFPVGYLTEWTGGMNYGLYQTGNFQSIVSSGFAGWGYGIRTQGHCEYVIVDIVPSAG